MHSDIADLSIRRNFMVATDPNAMSTDHMGEQAAISSPRFHIRKLEIDPWPSGEYLQSQPVSALDIFPAGGDFNTIALAL